MAFIDELLGFDIKKNVTLLFRGVIVFVQVLL